ncbi:hypothetical protein [Mucilaginibacter sp. L196]|uniref:hypothetical protein n=1 Tax=Mucilaginibacter sp. L196 TaxID=1641870 RepID=UPI00131DB2B8|nr:hypothetical protein [Mucilaginibacter sp. L196]
MTTEKRIATDGNRTYSFYLTNKTDTLISIEMYNSPYNFVLKDENWVNHSSNKMEMAPHLIEAVVAAT